MNRSLSICSFIVALLSLAFLPFFNNRFLSWWTRSSPSRFADLLVTNGTIYTSDDSLPLADSMAIRNGRIIRIGSRSSMQDLAAQGIRELNLDGKFVVPGFIDSHVHFISGGLQMTWVELRGISTKDEFVEKVREAITKVNHGTWILGGGWNNDNWGGELPIASWIDHFTRHNPVWLTRMDGHMGLANSFSMEIAKINNYTEDPYGGVIMRNSDGEPTGLVVDSAMKLVFSCIPEASIFERREALLRASRFASTKGVTTVVDFGRYFPGASVELPWQDLEVFYTEEWSEDKPLDTLMWC